MNIDIKILANREDNIDSKYEEANKLFKKYDDEYKNIKFPFSDEEFLEKNTKVLGLNYDGISFR